MGDKIELKDIYRPIRHELDGMEAVLEESMRDSGHEFIKEINSYLLESPGKRIRPALLILSAKATNNGTPILRWRELLELAGAVELIHTASLIHDDIIDSANVRHHRPTINSRWGGGVSIAMGDYLYSLAFGMISKCRNNLILERISSAVKIMCEGELLQVWERGNFNLSERQYIIIVKKKTASLFSACCEIGVLLTNPHNSLSNALKEYGMNLGVAFQIIDDYLDIIGEGKRLGKDAGQDIKAREMTLPVLKLWKSVSKEDKKELEPLLMSGGKASDLEKLRVKFFELEADISTKETASSFINLARENMDVLIPSPYKESLLNLTSFIMGKGLNGRH